MEDQLTDMGRYLPAEDECNIKQVTRPQGIWQFTIFGVARPQGVHIYHFCPCIVAISLRLARHLRSLKFGLDLRRHLTQFTDQGPKIQTDSLVLQYLPPSRLDCLDAGLSNLPSPRGPHSCDPSRGRHGLRQTYNYLELSKADNFTYVEGVG